MPKLKNGLFHFHSGVQQRPDFLIGLSELQGREIRMELYQKIGRLRRALAPFMEDYGEALTALLTRHGVKEGETLGPGDPRWPPFAVEWQELLDLDFEIPDALVVTADDLERGGFKTVPGAALQKLGPLFVDEPAEKPAA